MRDKNALRELIFLSAEPDVELTLLSPLRLERRLSRAK